MKVVACGKCDTKNRVDETRLSNNEAKCGRCGEKLEVGGNGAAGKPVVVTDASFQQKVLQASGAPLLVDFWAPWCGPCRVVGPIMDQLAAESGGRYRIMKLNVDENPLTASQYQIASIPTMLIFKDGALIDRIVGAQPKQAIADRLNRATTLH
ncbi:MAG TPA: thioredoxin TrxC [Pyrinomonadaceae bacterium]|nr:thioredoxin TrxC [Pyrinomonadaceae bacterium]